MKPQFTEEEEKNLRSPLPPQLSPLSRESKTLIRAQSRLL